MTSSRRDASVWMSSRSIGVMKLLSIRWLIVARQQVRLVLDVLDRLDVVVHVLDVAEQRVEHLRGRGEVRRELVEQLEELVVAREKAAEHGDPWRRARDHAQA